MNLEELRIRVAKNKKIPIDSYSFDGGLPNEALCISQQGEDWEIYYSERGKKTNLMTFKMESEACVYFHKRLLEMIGL